MRAHQSRRTRKAWMTVAIAVVAAIALIDAKVDAPRSRQGDSNAHQVRVRSAYGNLPLSFQKNRGQTNPQISTILVANNCSSEIAGYPIGSSGDVSPAYPLTGLAQPEGVAFDPVGKKIYVANYCNSTITI